MKVLITAGATEEPIDPIRYITNASSGKMGKAVAEEALKRNHSVTIIAATIKVTLPRNKNVKIYRVRTANEMIIKTMDELSKGYDILISTAAIADYTPIYSEKKIKSGNEDLTIKLKPNPKLTRMARERFKGLYIVAFKAEYDTSLSELVRSAYMKLRDENLDLVVGNDVKKNRMGSDENEVCIVNKRGGYVMIPKDYKERIAERIWDIIEEEFGNYSKD